MNKVVCSVFDVKAGIFSNPFYSPNLLVAKRDFSRGCTDPSSGLFCHPEDYSLFHLANFDDESGVFKSVTPPEFVASAASFKGAVL